MVVVVVGGGVDHYGCVYSGKASDSLSLYIEIKFLISFSYSQYFPLIRCKWDRG